MKLATLFVLFLLVAAAPAARASWCPIPGGPCFGPPNNPNPPPPPPPPPPGYGLCQSADYSGQFQNGRQAYLSVRTNGYYARGTLYLSYPNESYELRGDCRDYGGQADFSFQLRSGASYRARIYQASDYRIYMDGREDATGLGFVFQRR